MPLDAKNKMLSEAGYACLVAEQWRVASLGTDLYTNQSRGRPSSMELVWGSVQ